MKTVLFVIGILLFYQVGIAFSHAPSRLEMNYDKESRILSLNFKHKVRNPERHFVYRVRVRLNKKDVIEQNLDRQDTENGGSLVYKINGAKSGDLIEVRLNCNEGGGKSGKLSIE